MENMLLSDSLCLFLDDDMYQTNIAALLALHYCSHHSQALACQHCSAPPDCLEKLDFGILSESVGVEEKVFC